MTTELKKPSTSWNNSKKFLLDCQERIDISGKYVSDWLIILRKIQKVNILIGNMSLSKKKQVIVKFGKQNIIQKEYENSKILYEAKLANFIKYHCFFHCLEDITKFEKIETLEQSIQLCSRKGDDTWFIVMPYYNLGSVSNYKWTPGNFNILKNIISQVILAVYEAYYTVGFVHMDLHLGNVLLKKTTKKSIKYTSTGLTIDLLGYEAIIMDFERSNMSRNALEFKQTLRKLIDNVRDTGENGTFYCSNEDITSKLRYMNDFNSKSITNLLSHIKTMEIAYMKQT